MARIALALCCLLFVACDVSSPGDVAKSEIEDHLDSIKTAFALDDVGGLMAFFHPDYYHDGDTYQTLALKWELAMMEYQSLDFEDIDVDVNKPNARVQGSLTLHTDSGEVSWSLPEECADFSYWQLDGGEWRIMGQQY